MDLRPVLIGTCALLMSCGKGEVAIVEEDAAVLEMGAASMFDKASTPVGLPKACRDYVERVDACLARIEGHPSASLLEDSLDRARSQWTEAPDVHALVSSCRAENAGFTKKAAAMACE
ncbi:hypothetical protein [Luteimonas suaedae]|uniref:hypothetical protein n=1 Tax=Luteimonas suaedae TaxID=2605430 RepID=UPI0011EE1AEA|nr:hypothetical protein [Luteimonas suaedae]